MRQIGLLVGLLVLVFAAVAASEEVKGSKAIGEYPIGEFAVKGEVERQLNLLVKEIKESLEKGDGQLQITVVGSADTTGSSVSNDRLAWERAEQVAAVLSANFPEAKVVAWSKGDAENVRQVRVEYRFISTPLTPAPAPPASVVPVPVEKPVIRSETIYIALGIFVAAGIISFILVFLVRGKLEKATKTKPQPATGTQWIDIEVKGEKYSTRVEVKDSLWYSPFTSRSGTPIYRDSKRGIIESLKGCLKKDEFSEQRIGLIRKGAIKVAGKR